jgi:hypothetical protein
MQSLDEESDLSDEESDLSDEESDLSDSDTDTVEPEQDQPQPIVEIPPSNEELADLDTNGETSTQEHDKPETLSKLPGSADLSKLEVLENITEDFSHTRIVGKDGTFRGSHKAFVYKVRRALSLPRWKLRCTTLLCWRP